MPSPGPRTTAAVAYASAIARSGPTTVTDARPSAGGPGAGIDDVVAALVAARGRDREVGDDEHRRDPVAFPRVLDPDPPAAASPSGRPRVSTSPPALTKKFAAPASRRRSPARATAHPLTRPDGSSGASPGRGGTSAVRAEGDVERAVGLEPHLLAQREHGRAPRGSASATASSPRPMRMISVSARQVLNRSSTRANHDYARVERRARRSGSRTSMLMTVPHCSTTRRTGCMRESRGYAPALSSALCSDCA